MDATDVIDRQFPTNKLTLHQVLEPLEYAEYFQPVVDRFDSCRVNYTVDAWSWSTTDQDSYFA